MIQQAVTSYGISLESDSAYLAPERGIFEQNQRCDTYAVPPAALVPRLDGEPVRADAAWPLHPRGTGHTWPPEANVDLSSGSGRLPAAHAWELLQSHGEWRWTHHGSERSVRGSEALIAIARELVGTHSGDSEPQHALVIPNSLDEDGQQDLIDQARMHGLNLKLLWRPIAAGLVWCERFRDTLSTLDYTVDEPMGKLLVMYTGLETFELTSLDLVPVSHEGKMFFVPGRRRPNSDKDVCPSFGYEAFEKLADYVLAETTSGDRPSALWELMWCSSWLNDSLSDLTFPSLRQRRNALPQSLRLSDSWKTRQLWHQMLSQPNRAGSPGTVGSERLANGVTLSRNEDWIERMSSDMHRDRVVGTIACGALSALQLNSGMRLGTAFLERCGVRSDRHIVEGCEEPNGILAHGAAVYLRRLREGVPSYLDTLPRIRTAITLKGEPQWIDLLDASQHYVQGGKVWRRPENVGNLAIAAESEDLTLPVCHENHPFVRSITTSLPIRAENREPVGLAVTIEPAQGNARLEVVPDRADLFGRRRVIVDWKRMTAVYNGNGQQVTPEEYLESLPRFYPPLSPREGSVSRWRIARPTLEQCLRHISENGFDNSSYSHLAQAATDLQQKDQSRYPADCTAIGSEGDVLLFADILSRFVDTLVRRLKSGPGGNRDVVRAITYTSTAHPDFQEFLAESVAANALRIDNYVLRACGCCLRDPVSIRDFAQRFDERMSIRRDTPMEWLKAVSQILRYRGDATRDVDSALAKRMTEHALHVFEKCLTRRDGKYVFRYACLSIVYLLRRRAYDDDYLDPESELAIRTKDAFNRARTAVRERRLSLLRGSVDMAAALQIMIDYIDRRGSGKLLLGV